MKLGSLLGGGIVIYGVVALSWALMQAYGLSDMVAARAFEVLTLFVSCLFAGMSLRFKDWRDVLPYSIGWAVIAVALDALFLAPGGDWSLFFTWTDWLWYALIVAFPLVAPNFRGSREAAQAWET